MAPDTADSQVKESECPGRRAFLKTAVLAGGAITLTGVPLLSYVVAPALKKGTTKWIDFGPADTLKTGEVEMLSFEFMVKDGWIVLPQRGFVWAKSDNSDKITIFSSTCTHLACNVIWNKETKRFECPCHSGFFDSNGQPIAGPPTKPLVVMEHKVEEGKLMVLMPA
ncbi:MAG: ubiquinol-cytochrome c reductase iron-sulfur subunit [Desulfobacterales bacterium]